MRFCDVDALATGQPMGHSPEVSFMARPLSHAVGQKLPPGAGDFATCHLTEFPLCSPAQSSCNPSLTMISDHFRLSRVTRADACAELFGANSRSAASIRSRTSGN